MRNLFKGVLEFGLVSIPVELYKALDPKSVEMHWIHRQCGGRIHYQKFCPVCDRSVTADELVKATPLENGRLVWLEDQALSPGKSDHTIAILSFHPLADLDPVYYDQPYWLKPAKGTAKAYRLLWEATTETQRVAIAEFRFRTQPRLALIRPYHTGTLMLHSMHYPEQLREDGANFGALSGMVLSAKERKMAQNLIAEMSEPFRSEQYPNRAQQDLLARIQEQAARGQTPPHPEAPVEAMDLIAQLKASVERAHDRTRETS